MTDFVHRTIILERFRRSQYSIMSDLILTMKWCAAHFFLARLGEGERGLRHDHSS